MTNEEIEKAAIEENRFQALVAPKLYPHSVFNEGFIAGANWMKEKMPERASKGFDEFLIKEWDELERIHGKRSDYAESVWQAAKLSSEKELSELREENKRLKHELELGVELIKDAEASYREAVKDIKTLWLNSRANYISEETKQLVKQIIKKHGLE